MKDKEKNYGKFLIGIVLGMFIACAIFIIITSVPLSNKIGIIGIKGTITSSQDFMTETVSPEDVASAIKMVENDPSYKAAIFQINSPGGSVVASREIAGDVKRMKKPTVCWLGDVAASGAYWVASACDFVVADDLSLTGSVGVTASYLEFSKLFEKYGVTYEQITSGGAKDIGSPYRNMTAEEREKMQYIVNETFRYFIEDVAYNRGLNETQVGKIISGDVFLGKDAIGLGLVDQLGNFEDAKDVAKELAGLGGKDVDFMEFGKRGFSLLDLLGML